MRVVIVAATAGEVTLLTEQAAAGAFQPLEVQVLITGIGMVNTAFVLGQLVPQPPDWLVNVGICGAFDRSLALGSAVQIVSETYPDLGAEDYDRWLDLQRLGFANFHARGQAWYNVLSNPQPPLLPLLPVTGATSNTVLGHRPSITLAQARHPSLQVQTMEGAAFFQSALMLGAQFTAIRGVSNYVEPRNRNGWQLLQAVDAAERATSDFLRKLAGKG